MISHLSSLATVDVVVDIVVVIEDSSLCGFRFRRRSRRRRDTFGDDAGSGAGDVVDGSLAFMVGVANVSGEGTSVEAAEAGDSGVSSETGVKERDINAGKRSISSGNR